MSSIIHITNKSTGIVYAYESFSYWDKEAKAPRTRRVYLGRVDENGNIIPKKQKASNAQKDNQPDSSANYKAQYEKIVAENEILKAKIQSLETELSSARKTLLRLSKLCDSQKECIDAGLLPFEKGSKGRE